MSMTAVILCGAILAILVARAAWIMRAEARRADGGRPRGVEPGEGHVEIRSEYMSGVGGGSQMTSRVPRDPDAYARAFVPRRLRRDE
jgi:hypothetical protein